MIQVGNNGKVLSLPNKESFMSGFTSRPAFIYQSGCTPPTNPTVKLPVGTYDMSDRELVSFQRSTKAWLDGKEYGIDVPRYTTDGKLLIEGQNTNMCHSPIGEIGYVNGSTCWTKQSTPDAPMFPNLLAETFIYKSSGEAPRIRLVSAGDTVESPSKRLGIFVEVDGVRKINYGTDGSGHSQYSVVYDLVNLTCTKLSYVQDAKIVKLGENKFYLTHTLTPDAGVVGNRHYIKMLDIDDSAKITITSPHAMKLPVFDEFIPFSATQVTRAADIARVRNK